MPIPAGEMRRLLEEERRLLGTDPWPNGFKKNKSNLGYYLVCPKINWKRSFYRYLYSNEELGCKSWIFKLWTYWSRPYYACLHLENPCQHA